MLGHDVNYYRAAEDKKLVEMAKSEKRILLTRDLGLYQQAVSKGLEAFFVEVADEAEKLAALARRFKFKLRIDLSYSRCPKCNGVVVAVSKEVVITQLPEATSTYYNNFWKCPICGQLYWQGAHWKRIQMTLEKANSSLCLL